MNSGGILLSCCLLSQMFICVHISPETTLNGFIATTHDTLMSLRQNDKRGWPKYLSEQYNLTDRLRVKGHDIRLMGLCIQVNTLMQYMHIFECGGMDSFFLAVHYFSNRDPDFNAYIIDVNTAEKKSKMTGTQTMVLIHYILFELGVKQCSLQNCAKIHYEYCSGSTGSESHGAFIPLIYLRSIKGKTVDWYSDFGYFNENEQRIAAEMARIHSIPYKNTSFGPWLYALWRKEDKTDFHIAYQDNLWRFSALKQLRDSTKWISFLK